MGSITTEAGVLKLVRPGRRLEVHKEAITAAEVMKKYPRHSITRPDIFEFPWIVVKPEAVLPPGKVFFIVPNRTIYQLLKAREQAAQPPTEHKDSTKDHRHHSLSEKISPPKGVTTSKHLDQRRRLKQQFFSFSCATVSPSDEEPESDQKGPQTDIRIGAGAELSLKKKTTPGDLKQKPPMHSIVGTRNDKEHERRKNAIAAKIAGLKIRESTQVILMKSCLRKPDSARKLLCLKVNFTLPRKEEEQLVRQRRDSDPRKQYPGYSSR